MLWTTLISHQFPSTFILNNTVFTILLMQINNFLLWYVTAAKISVLYEEERAAADRSGDGRAAEGKCSLANNIMEELQEATAQIHPNGELIDCFHQRVSLLEKHLDEAVVTRADIEKCLCEVEDKPKRKDEEFIFVFVFSGSESCGAQKRAQKKRSEWYKRKEWGHDKDQEISKVWQENSNSGWNHCTAEPERLSWKTPTKERNELQERALRNKQRDQKWAAWPLWPGGVTSSTGVSTTERAEGDSPGRIQLLESRAEREPAGDRWGNHSASGKMSQEFLRFWVL